MSQVDDIALSSYLDGELDYNRAKKLTYLIHHDPDVHERLVDMATTQALLKSIGREKAREEIPNSLIQALNRRKQKKVFLPGGKQVLQVAAAVLLFIGSFFLGRNNGSSQYLQSSNFPVIPVSLEQTINNVLEYQKSGSVQTWVEIEKGVTARVTPVRTFRGSQGEFYRMFVVDMELLDSEQQFWGMAMRSGKERWQTKGVFTNGIPGNV